MPKTVLIADESITIRSVAESLLRGEAYSVRSAADGQTAVELATAERPDLILIGEKLPGISGPDVCTQIKSNAELSSVPIIFMRTDRPGEQPANVDAVLTKPFSPQTLLEAVKRFMGGGPAAEGVGAQVVAVEDGGLADELIDKAFGLDDVITGTETEPSSRAPVTESSQEPSVEPFGTIPADEDEKPPTPASPQMEKHEVDSLDDFEVQMSMPEASSASAGGSFLDPHEDEIDRALDEAFGSESGEAAVKPAADPAPIPLQASSLEEVSLGEPSAPASPQTPRSGRESGTILPPQAGGDESERPHDYEWFISEMGKDGGPASPAPRAAADKPRIEPVTPQAKSSSKPDTGTRRKASDTTSSEFDIDVEEFEASKRGYDEFISEFRKEIARLEGAVAPGEGDDHAKHDTDIDRAFSEAEASGQMNADLKALGDRLIEVVAQSVARELAANVDPKRIYAIIEAKLSEVGKPQS